MLTPVGFLSRHSSGLQGSKLTFSYVNSDVPYGNDAVFLFSSLSSPLHPLTAAVWPIYLCPHTVMLAHEKWSDSSFVRIKMLFQNFKNLHHLALIWRPLIWQPNSSPRPRYSATRSRRIIYLINNINLAVQLLLFFLFFFGLPGHLTQSLKKEREKIKLETKFR